MIAWCLVKLERPGEALEHARASVKHGADLAFSHYMNATALLELGRQRPAKAAIDEVLRIDASDPDYHALRCAILFEQKRFGAAAVSVERALALDPTHRWSLAQQSEVLARRGLYRASVDNVRTTLRHHPESVEAHVQRGWHALDALELTAARAAFQEALRARFRVYRWLRALGAWVWRPRTARPKLALAGVVVLALVASRLFFGVRGLELTGKALAGERHRRSSRAEREWFTRPFAVRGGWLPRILRGIAPSWDRVAISAE